MASSQEMTVHELAARRGVKVRRVQYVDREGTNSGAKATVNMFVAASPSNTIRFTAVTSGSAGNNITIALVDPGVEAAIDVTVSGTAITVSLERDSAGDLRSHPSDVVAAVNADAEAELLVRAAVSGGDDAAFVLAVAATNLEGGFDSGPADSWAILSLDGKGQEQIEAEGLTLAQVETALGAEVAPATFIGW